MVGKQTSVSHLSSFSEFMCISLCLKQGAAIWTSAPSESQADSPKPAGVWSGRCAPAMGYKPTEPMGVGARGRTIAYSAWLKPPSPSNWPDKRSVPFPACFSLRNSYVFLYPLTGHGEKFLWLRACGNPGDHCQCQMNVHSKLCQAPSPSLHLLTCVIHLPGQGPPRPPWPWVLMDESSHRLHKQSQKSNLVLKACWKGQESGKPLMNT